MPSNGTIADTRPGRSRLQPAEDRPRFAPWMRAWKLQGYQLYWLGVSATPLGHLQRRWLLRFQELLHVSLASKHELQPEVFMQMNVILPDHRDAFIRTSRTWNPMFGLGRHPGRALPPIPDEKYAEDLQKGRVQYNHTAIRPDYSYWFLKKEAMEQLRMFFGSGGSTTTFIQPEEPPAPVEKPRLTAIHDPNLRAMVERADVDGAVRRLHSLQAPWLAKSKEMFAADLKEDPQYPGLLFALPLLGSEDFLNATPDQLKDWFSLFSVYFRESPEDKGILLASEKDIEEDLEAILEQMRNEDLEYRA